MSETRESYYKPDETGILTPAVSTAVARAHDGDGREQAWLIGEDIGTDGLDGLFDRRGSRYDPPA